MAAFLSPAKATEKCWLARSAAARQGWIACMAIPKWDTIVIGGGVAGLTCALLAERRGEHVLVVERSGHLSPALYGFVRKGTYVDSGFHYAGSVGTEGLARHLLHELGLVEFLDGAVQIPDAIDHVRFLKPAFDFSFPQSWEPLAQNLCRVFPSDSRGVRSFLTQVRSLWEQSRDLFRHNRGRTLGGSFPRVGRSLQEALDNCAGNPVLRGLLRVHGVLYGACAQETSLLFHSQVVGSYYESAGLVRGGGRAWVEAFGRALCDAGVEWKCGGEVAHIHLNPAGEFAAVELETGERLAADRCISTIHPKRMLEIVPSNAFSPAYRKRVLALEETPSAVVLYGRCHAASFSGNLYLASELRTLSDWRLLPVEERPLFVSLPPGGSGASVICPACPADVPGGGADRNCTRSADYRDWKGRLTDRLMERLSCYAHDLVGDFEPLDMATPLTFRDRLGSPEGGLYGIKHRMMDMPLLPRTRVEGLYLSGQAVVAPGVLGALCAGFFTDSCIARPRPEGPQVAQRPSGAEGGRAARRGV
jgi:all-trans-retinol 13,14-reductase